MAKPTINAAHKKKRGRPPNPEGRRVSIPISFGRGLVERIDAYATRSELTRSEAVRQLVERGLGKARRASGG